MIKSIILAATMVTATVYHAVEGQTDDTPLITASLKHINPDNPIAHRWIAVSRVLEPLGFTFDVKVCVEGAGDLSGEWCVNDRMNARWKHRIDFLVDTTRKTGYWKNVKLTLIEE